MRRTTLEQQSQWLATRKKELGLKSGDYGYVAVNAGARRSPEKQRLLKKLKAVARKSRRALKFSANV